MSRRKSYAMRINTTAGEAKSPRGIHVRSGNIINFMISFLGRSSFAYVADTHIHPVEMLPGG